MNVNPGGDVPTLIATLCARACGTTSRQLKTAARANFAAEHLFKANCALERSEISDTRSLDSEVSIRVNPQKYTTNFGNGGIASHFDH
jgi:hypothetical protein